MSEPKRVGRRTFLNYAIAVVATGVIVGAATYYAAPKGAETVTVPGATTTITAPGGATTIEKSVTTTITAPGPTTTVTSTPIKKFKIALLNHCPKTVDFWARMMDAGRVACEALGLDYTLYFADGNMPAQADKIREFTAAGYNAIVTSIPDPTLFDDPIGEAVKKGIIVVAWQDDDYTPNPRTAYVGPESNVVYGQKLANALPEIPKGKKVLFLSEALGTTWATQRYEGVKSFFEPKGVPVVTLDLSNDMTVAEQRLTSFLIANPDVYGIVGSDGVGSNTAATVLIKNYKVGEIYMSGGPTTDITIRALELGYMKEGIVNSYYVIGYTAPYYAYILATQSVLPTDISLKFFAVHKEDAEWLRKWFVRGS